MRMVVGWLVGLLSLFSRTEEQLMSKQKKKKKNKNHVLQRQWSQGFLYIKKIVM
jgi:hypothetical protein